MKCLCFLLGGFTIALAIQVPSSWHEEDRNGPNSRYKDMQILRTNKNSVKPQSFNPPEIVYMKPKVQQRHRKSSWSYVPKYKKKAKNKSMPYKIRKSHEQKDSSVLRPVQPESNIVQSIDVNRHFPETENTPSIDSYQISPKRAHQTVLPQPTLTVTPFLSIHHSSTQYPSYISKQETPKQNRLLDFIRTPLDFREFDHQSSIPPLPKFQQAKPISHEPSPHLIPYQNVGGASTVPANHKIQNETTELKQQTINGSPMSHFQNFDQTFNIPFNHEFVSSNNKYKFDPMNHLFKNYRDDKTHEPIAFDPFLDNKPLPTIERDESEKAPVSSHEYPADIPTKPIYPGEGMWARRGLSHKPFISKQQYETLEKDSRVPDGYDTFMEGEKLFNQQQQKFYENVDALSKKQNMVSPKDKQQHPDPNVLHKEAESFQNEAESFQNEETAEVKNAEDDERDEDFVPMKLYAQVRHSEDVQHVPTHEDENGRLREAIKESKIQTVYTEEGYEDNAYDHEGHEKEAENKEEFEELDRGQEKTEEKRVPHEKYNLHLVPKIESTRYSSGLKLPTDEEIENHKKAQLGLGEDSDIAGSQYIDPGSADDDGHTVNRSNEEFQNFDSPAMKKSNNFISTKEIKTMTTKEKDDGDTETEISSKIKVIMQPNNTAGSQEFIQINPRVYKNVKKVLGVPDSHESMEKVKSLPTSTINEPNSHGIYIEEVITTSSEQPLTTVTTTEFPEIMTEEIPITTLPTTAMTSSSRINSDLYETSKNINEAFARIDNKSRKKRFVNDFPDIKVNNEFISKIEHDLVKPQEDYKKAKYPYYTTYKQMNLNENSPLRYSEDLNNIPVKTRMKMAFYDQADGRIECPEIESTVEPIPERIQTAGQEHESDEEYDDDSDDGEFEETKNKEINKTETLAEQPKGPRLNMLGDKIDCLKARYFGKNPLDSPFFDEDTVGPVKPIFGSSDGVKSETENGRTDFENVSAETQDPPSSINYEDNEIIHDINEDKQIEVDTMDPKFKAINVTDKDTTLNEFKNDDSHRISTAPTVDLKDKSIVSDTPIKFVEEIDEEKLGLNVFSDISQNMKSLNRSENKNVTQVSSTKQNIPTISLLTTPGYTIDLKPKHIYDQIHLLNYLPEEQRITNNESDSTVEHFVQGIGTKLMNNSDTDIIDSDVRQQKSYEAEEEDNLTYDSSSMTQVLPGAEALQRKRKFRIRKRRPGFQIFDINRFIPTPYTIRRDHPHSNSGESKRLEIFDINKFLPTTPHQIIANPVTSSMVLPKYKVMSEVFYKDNINTNEQLNVFTDVLNNIRNSSAELMKDSSQEPSDINIASNILKDNGQASDTNKYNQDTYSNKYNNYDQEVVNQYHPFTVPTPIYTAGQNEGKMNWNKPGTTNHPIENRDEKLKHYVALLQAKMRKSGILQNESPAQFSTTAPKEDEHFEKVEGMYPPGTQHYKTIYNPKRDNSGHLSIPGYVGMNKYLVMGMKPPPRQKVLIYSDFLLNNNQLRKKMGLLRRGRRSTNRAAYAEVSRDTASTGEDDEKATNDDEDEYVPHRPKNYYYDEKTGKIVYNKTDRPLEEEEEVEYIEITEAPPPKTTSKPKQNPIFATATPPPDGQSYVDFVKKLKSAADYKFIPDPTTTEKNAEMSTEKVTTLSSISTTPPEYLSILNKVRKTDDYKFIEDPTEKKSTTTEASEEAVEEEYEEETMPTNVRNSPGGDQHNIKSNFQIFDISDYIPKLKNYLPSTSIDYSKYKTINRPAPKHNQDTDEDHQETEGDHKGTDLHSTEEPPVESSSLSGTNENEESLEEDEMSVESISSVVPIITTTTTAPIKIHSTSSSRRRRPTTLRSTRTTTKSTPLIPSTLATAESQEVRNEKPKRNYRRRPTRIKSTTTERFLDDDFDDTTKILRRRKIDENRDSKLTRHRNSKQIITLDKRNGTLVGKILNPDTTQPEKRVEVFQKYNRYNKHGGNYRKEDENEQKQKLLEPMSGATRKSKDVEIIGEFDKTKRHGGNYESEDANIDEQNATSGIPDQIEDIEPQTLDSSYSKLEDQPLIVQLLPKYEDEETRNQNSSGDQDTRNQIKRKRIIRKHKKNPENVKPIGRLTDVVLKPESFYSDPNLPQTVNLLVLAQPLSNEEAVENFEIGDGTSTENLEFTEVDSTATTKKPDFIKDPGERLYYYAPV